MPPDANTLLSVADHCLRSRNYVNLIVSDKQPHLQYLTMEEAISHCTKGASIWEWAGTEGEEDEPDVVLAAAGDVPTMETLAAAQWLRDHVPGIMVRVVNVVDLMTLFQRDVHPHGMSETDFVDLLHRRQAGNLRLPRLPARDPRTGAWQGQRAPVPRAGVQRAGHHHHAVQHGRAERDEPVSPGSGGDPPLDPFCARGRWLHRRTGGLVRRATAHAIQHMEDPPEIANWTWTARS